MSEEQKPTEKTTEDGKRKRRTHKQIQSTILDVLKQADYDLSTSDVAKGVNCAYAVAKGHLMRLEFQGRVARYKAGQSGAWSYWKIKR